jgi:hypothetical protein
VQSAPTTHQIDQYNLWLSVRHTGAGFVSRIIQLMHDLILALLLAVCAAAVLLLRRKADENVLPTENLLDSGRETARAMLSKGAFRDFENYS